MMHDKICNIALQLQRDDGENTDCAEMPVILFDRHDQ